MDSLFSERLKAVRLEKGLTQEDIAAGIKVGKSTFCQYELGTRRPDLETIIKISEYLGTSADYLLGISDNPNEKMKESRAMSYPMLSGLIREFFSDENISQSEKDILMKDINTVYWKYKK